MGGRGLDDLPRLRSQYTSTAAIRARPKYPSRGYTVPTSLVKPAKLSSSSPTRHEASPIRRNFLVLGMANRAVKAKNMPTPVL